MENFVNHLKHTDKNIILFGAGAVGEQILRSCQANEIQIACFCDNHPQKNGQVVNGVLVLPLEEIKKKYAEPIFILSPLNEIHQKNIAKQLELQGFTSYHSAREFFENIGESTLHVLEKSQANRLKMRCYESVDSEKMYIESIDLMITERCTLRCKDCSSLMPYYEKPMDCQKTDLFAYIDRIDELFDVVGELRILGGEPLIHPNFYEIIRYAQTKSTFECIKIYTNATILPKKEELQTFDTQIVAFYASNYPNLSMKMKELCALLSELDISYMRNDMEEWIQCTKIQCYHRTEQELEHVYRGCLAKICRTVSDGKLFTCPFLAHADRLQALPKISIDFIDLMDTTLPNDIIQKEIKQYIYGVPFLKGCDYCSSRNLEETIVIPVAVQTKEVLSYTKYER